MLKLWKKTCNDSERHQTSNPDCASSASQLKNSTLNSSSGPVGIKRLHENVESESHSSSTHGRPAKIPKIAHDDSLRTHLPEIASSFQDDFMTPASLPTFRTSVLEQAKRENTMVVLPPLKATGTVLAHILQWAVDNEHEKRLSDSYRPRTALLVVEHEITANKYLGILNNEMNSVTINKYMKPYTLDKPRHLLKKDICIIQTQLLLDAMSRGFLKMNQVHTLVIGDIEHIKEQDSNPSLPIVQIMNDFYFPCGQSLRPRVLALASPAIDCWTLYDSRMLKLEATLDCKLFGVPEGRRQEIFALPDRPNEAVILYEPSNITDETPLFKQLHQLDPKESLLRKQFKIARYTHLELGSCAADLVWRRALKTIGSLIDVENTDDEEDSIQPCEDTGIKVRDIIKNWAFTMCNLDPTSHGCNVTHKFRRLMEVLQSCEPYDEAFRAIIFVRRRAIALILSDLLRTLEDKLHFVRPCVLTGKGSAAGIQYQLEVFEAFSSGAYNVLIATKSVEDLIIPKATVVIRYDVFDSQTSLAFSRACTRGRESHLIHLIERGNCTHRRILSMSTNLDVGILRWTENLCKSPESSVPPPTLFESGKAYHSDSEDEDRMQEYIEDPTTSGRIYPEDAVTVVYRFAARNRKNDMERSLGTDSPLFIYKDMYRDSGSRRSYVCGIILPGAPIDALWGSPSLSKAHARRTVCFQACKILADSGLLDCNLFSSLSVYGTIGLTSFTKVEEGESSNFKTGGHKKYPRKMPDFWKNTENFSCATLYPTVIYTSQQLDQSKLYAPIVLFTRRPMPEIPAFRVFLSGAPLPMEFCRFPGVNPNEEQLDKLHKYTTRIYRAILNKPWTCAIEDLLCFFGQLRRDWKPASYIPANYNIMLDIPWEAITMAADNWAIPVPIGSPTSTTSELEDSIILDRCVEFTRRYEYVRLRTDMTPHSKPADSPREEPYGSLLNFARRSRRDFEGLKDENQPIVEVHKVPVLSNHLNPVAPVITETKASAKYFIPELCAKFTLPASVMRTALLMPSILHRIDGLLAVKEVNAKLFNHLIRQDLLHIALCTPSAGNEYDYERLEFLGDSFLKYMASIYIFVNYPSQPEGMLHQTRQRFISNKSLLLGATNVQLPVYIQSKPFLVKEWQLPVRNTSASSDIEMSIATSSTSSKNGLPVADGNSRQEKQPDQHVTTKKQKKQKHNKEWQFLGDKTIADVAEAVIGAAYISGGRETGLQVAKALSLPITDIDQWSDLCRKMLTLSTPPVMAKLKDGAIEAVEKIIGHKILRPHILAQAMSHTDIEGWEMTSYERLEFIGDGILDFMIVRYIFDREQQLNPGALTLLKTAMVSNSTLAAVLVDSGLHEYLHSEVKGLNTSIREYVKKVQARQKKAYQIAQEGGQELGQYWYDLDAPKPLSDFMESIIGAIYISDDFSPLGVEALFDNVLRPFYDKHIRIRTISHHATKTLLEYFQAAGCQQYEIEKEELGNRMRCNVVVHDTVLATAEDATSALASKHASTFALDALEGDADFMKRICDCRMHGKKGKGKNAVKDALSALES